MSFLGGIINRIIREFNHIKNSVIQRFQPREQEATWKQIARQYGDPTTRATAGLDRNIEFSLRARTAEAQGVGTASLTVLFSGDVPQSILRDIGEYGIGNIRDWLRPIHRTGQLESSFQYVIDPIANSVVIYSDLPQASSIARGINVTGSQSNLIAWLRTKPEHASKTHRELKQTAYFIQRSINQGRPPGPKSTLRSLAPVGRRSYDYLNLAAGDIERYIERLLDEAWARMD